MGMETDYVVQARARAAAGDVAGALDAIDSGLTRDSNNRNLRIFRARLLQSLGHVHDALAEIVSIDHGIASARLLGYRAELEEAARMLPEALQTLTRAVRLEPENGSIRARRSLISQSLGDFKSARADLERALSHAPGDGGLLFHLAGLTKFSADTPLLEEMKRARKRAREGSPEAFHLDFGLARALDQIGEVEASFQHLERANAAMRKAYPYDIAQRHALVNRYQRVFRDFSPAEYWDDTSSEFAPIFVTGMPRSGTTLVEQVISSHGRVDAAGETGLFFKALQAHIGDPMVVAPSKLHLGKDAFSAAGRAYASALVKLVNPTAPYVTDKSLQTVVYLGLVLAALPKARVVVVERGHQATALSIFRHMFRPGKQLFSYDLKDIAAYQSTFDSMVEFWGERCPGAFQTVRYEDLVRSPGEATPQLICDLGLGWDPACLAPEKNSRAVMTLSASEVRQPIHTNSIDAWRRYEAFLT